MSSFRNKIEQKKNILASVKTGATAIVALATFASNAEAFLYTETTGETAPYLNFNPLTGAYSTSESILVGAYNCADQTVFEGPHDYTFLWVGSGNNDCLQTAGTTIDSASAVFNSTGNQYGMPYFDNTQLTVDTPAYLSFKMVNQGTNSDENYFGWVSFEYKGSISETTLAVLSFYVTDEGASSMYVGQTGAVPEPSTTAFGFGALALIGVAARRRKSDKVV